MNGSAPPPTCGSDDVTDGDKLFRFVTHGVLLNGIGAAGLLGNALSVLVLSRPQMRSSINCLLVGLAGCDTAVILTSIMLFGLTAIYPYTGHLRYYYYYVSPFLTPYVYPLATSAQTMSVYLTLIVTIERWVAVCHPFRAKALCTSARARWYVLGTAVFALLYNAPRFFEAGVGIEMAPNGTDYVYCIHPTPIRNATYVVVYINWMYMVVMYFVPFTALAALNACIVRQVRRAQAERARLSRVQRRELSLATMLLVVVLVFFLCNILPLVTNALEVLLGDNGFEDLDALVKMTNLFVMINSSVNFVIYVIFGEKFKRVFLSMFCAKRLARGSTRESPDHTRDDSFASCGERVSLRMVRNGTLRRSAGGGGTVRWGRASRAHAAPTVYYPYAAARPAPASASAHTSHTDVTLATTPEADTPLHRWNGSANDHF